jgi:DNA-binding PadR family transcriptional regulator
MRDDGHPTVTLRRDLLSAWLLLLLREGAGHGYRMRQELAARGFTADRSAVYRTLRDLEQRGLVRSSWVPSADGAARHMYEITGAGHAELDRAVAALTGERNAQSAFLRAYRDVHDGSAVG